MNISYYESKIGNIKIVDDNEHIIEIKLNEFGENIGNKDFSVVVFKEIEEYLSGERKSFSTSLNLKGTEFQKKVWNALLQIPYGEVRSYKDIAKAIGNEKAVRAVGSANNKNPILLLVPCHRVIGTNGKLVGYAAGLEIKETLLNLEKKNK